MKLADLKESEEYKGEWQDLCEQVKDGEISSEEAELHLLECYFSGRIYDALKVVRDDLKELGVNENVYYDMCTSIFEQLDDTDDLFPGF